MRLDLFPGPSWFSRGCVDELFSAGVVRRRRRRRLHDRTQDGVEMVGEMVATWIDVDGRRESLDEEGLLDASADPVLLS